MKILTALGNKEIYERIEEGNYEIIDEVDSLDAIEEMVELMPMDALIINRLMDDDGKLLIRIGKKAIKKGIKVIVITDDYEDFSEKKLITSLVNEGVTAFLKLEQVTIEAIERILRDYPEEFDYSLFASEKEIVKVEKHVESVFKEVITVYSPLSQGATTTAVHLAYALSTTKKCRVCVVDFNPLKPAFRKIFGMNFDFTLPDFLDAVTRQNLTYERLEELVKPYKLQTNLDILPGIYDLNEYYGSNSSQYEEIIQKLRFNYDYVIIDTHSWFDVITTDVALRIADQVLVPIHGGVHDIDETNRYFEKFRQYNDFNILNRRFKFIINAYGDNDLTCVELEAKLKGEIAGYISYHQMLQKKNAFKEKKVINEYINILNAIGIRAEKQKSFDMKLFHILKRQEGRK